MRYNDESGFFFCNLRLIAVCVILIFCSRFTVKAVPGNLDWTFGSGGRVSVHIYGSDSARDLAIQPDGKIVIAGISAVSPNRDFSIARLNPDGTLDNSFGNGGTVQTPFDNFNSRDDAWAMALQPDGKIIVAGTYSGPLQIEMAVARYNPDGSLDLSFDGDGKLTIPFSGLVAINDLALQTDGRIVLAGSVAGAGFIAVRLNSDGSLDATFGGDGTVVTAPASTDASGYAIAIQSDSKIIIAGMARGGATGTGQDFALVRYNTDGSLDTSFDGDGKVTTAIGSGGLSPIGTDVVPARFDIGCTVHRLRPLDRHTCAECVCEVTCGSPRVSKGVSKRLGVTPSLTVGLLHPAMHCACPMQALCLASWLNTSPTTPRSSYAVSAYDDSPPAG